MSSPAVSLGPLSDLAANYLQGLNAWNDPILRAEAERRRLENDVVAAMIAIKRARAERRPYTELEHELLRSAEEQVRRGVQPPALFKPIGRSGARPRQTLISLADGGEGHLGVTLRDADLLDGVVVHHEVIDRLPGLTVAPYRMIDIRQNGVIRLHAADDVPVSVYCGRPTCQSNAKRGAVPTARDLAAAYRTDPVTPSHGAAAMASAAFANGVADVKFCLDGLTMTQAVDFMCRVKECVDKRDDQTLSTQFNLNRPLIDDRQTGDAGAAQLPKVADKAAICRRAVELTKAGGWDRVTLDSSSDKIPSVPFVELLGFDGLASWVDEAHAAGLDTYISGGMSAAHIELATYAGVDGVGIGFWIHHQDGTNSGKVGSIDDGKVRQAIRVRNEAEASRRGLAARLLARLHCKAEVPEDSALRSPISHDELFHAVLSSDEAALVRLLEHARGTGLM